MSIEAMKQALEALEALPTGLPRYFAAKAEKALPSLRAAIEAAEKAEPRGYLVQHYEDMPHIFMWHPLPAGYCVEMAELQAEVEALRKVMQQALDALVDSVDLVREDYRTDWRHGIPTRAAQLEGKKAELDRHEQTIAAIDAAMQTKVNTNDNTDTNQS